MFSVTQPFQQFFDINGSPLSSGYIYIGEVNKNPYIPANQIPLYWDSYATQPAAQPVRTINGYASRSGSASNIFVSSPYSMAVYDSRMRLVFYVADASKGNAINLAIDLASSDGAGMIGGFPTYASLRSYNGASRRANIIGKDIAGLFYLDELDVTSPDDGGVTIIDALGRRWKRFFSGDAQIYWWGIGRLAATDDQDLFGRALAYCQGSGAPLDLAQSKVRTSGGHTFNGELIASGATIMRTTGYSGNSPLLELGNGSRITGKLFFDGNNPIEAGQNMASLLVSGDDVTADEVHFLNTPCTFALSTQFRGITVTGDRFDAGVIKGFRSGYSTLQLLLNKQLSSFNVDRLESFDHDFKGFVCNGSSGSVGSVTFDSIYTLTATTQDASDCVLIDTGTDKTQLNVKNVHIGFAKLIGARSQPMKLENVETFTFGSLYLRPANPTISAASAARLNVKNVIGDSISYEREWLRLFCENFSVRMLIPINPNAVNLIRAEDTTFTTIGTVTIGKIVVQGSTTNLTQLIGFSYANSTPLYIDVGDAVCAKDIPMFGSFNANTITAVKNGACIVHASSYRRAVENMWGGGSLNLLTQIPVRRFAGTAPPTFGKFVRGDIVQHTNARVLTDGSGNYVTDKWICTTAGEDAAAVFTEEKIRL